MTLRKRAGLSTCQNKKGNTNSSFLCTPQSAPSFSLCSSSRIVLPVPPSRLLRIETLAIPPVLFGYSRLPFCLKIYGVLGDLFAAPRTPYSFSIIGTLMNCTSFCPLHYGVLLIHFSVPMDETINQCCHIVRLRVRFHRLCKSEESSHWFRKQPYRSRSVQWYQPIRPHNDTLFRSDPKILPNCLL